MAEYIEREAALEAVSFYDEGKIRAIPAADVREVVRGKWIPVNDDDATGDTKCSLCGCYHHVWEAYGYFCQHCGADMREVD